MDGGPTCQVGRASLLVWGAHCGLALGKEAHVHGGIGGYNKCCLLRPFRAEAWCCNQQIVGRKGMRPTRACVEINSESAFCPRSWIYNSRASCSWHMLACLYQILCANASDLCAFLAGGSTQSLPQRRLPAPQPGGRRARRRRVWACPVLQLNREQKRRRPSPKPPTRKGSQIPQKLKF